MGSVEEGGHATEEKLASEDEKEEELIYNPEL